MKQTTPPRVVVMGVAGCGKSTVGVLLADALDARFVDGDDLHPRSNIVKMAAGVPLNDDDRWPWLADIGEWLAQPDGGVVAASALKRVYRDAIRAAAPDAVFVHLTAPPAVLRARIEARSRTGQHFMGAAMLDSQLAILEPLGEGEGFEIDVELAAPGAAAAEAARHLARPLQGR